MCCSCAVLSPLSKPEFLFCQTPCPWSWQPQIPPLCLEIKKKKDKRKDLNGPDNHHGVITQLEPDILECEVKWALGSIITNQVNEVIEFQLSYFKSWKMMLSKSCTQHASKFGKLSSGHRTGKGQFSFQSQRKAMPKNAQTTAQLHLSHTLVK